MSNDFAPPDPADKQAASVSDSNASHADAVDQPERDPFEELATEFSERHRRGEVPSIEAYAEAHPDLASEIRELFPTIAAMEQLKDRKAAPARAMLGGLPLEQLGDFRILGEIGRGGMGVVYEAEQVSLGRHVAVKVLPKQALLDERHLRRFQREAQTAAKLHHTNIVPVFGVGQQDGYHYIVMQFIHGVGLDEILIALRKLVLDQEADALAADSSSRASHASHNAKALLNGQFDKQVATGLSSSMARGLVTDSRWQATDDMHVAMLSTQAASSPAVVAEDGHELSDAAQSLSVDQSGKLAQLSGEFYHSVAKIGAQVADALAYAHDQGTLHRDIKPGNLLLDGSGTVWVADFGLAKLAEHDNVSRTGDLVGTLSYMPPESFSGEADARGDIYALGLTLYELLAMRPAYYGRDRAKLVREITEGGLPRLGKLNPSIPRDLETIVLKAIAHRPDDRYANAAELVEDLECYMGDLPIKARRMSVPEQFARWCRKNKLVATLAASVLTLLILTAGLAMAAAKTQSDLATLEQERADAQQQRADAQAQLRAKAEENANNAELARQDALQKARKTLSAFKNVFYKIAPPRLPLSADAVEETSLAGLDDEQETSLPIAETDEEQLIAAPPINEQMASILSGIVEEVNKLSDEFSSEGIFALTSADLTLQAGTFYFRLGKNEQAKLALERAARKYQKIVDSEEGEAAAAIVGLAMSYNELGNVRGAEFGRRGSHPEYEKAEALLRQHAAQLTDSSRAKYELARTLFLLEFNPMRAERGPAGPPGLGRRGPGGRGPRGAGTERPPRGPDGPPPVGQRPGQRAGGGRPEGRGGPSFRANRGDGEKNLREAIGMLTRLVEEDPAAEYLYLLARCHQELRLDGDGEGPSEAKRILEELVKTHPNEPEYQYELAMSLARAAPPPWQGRGSRTPERADNSDYLADLRRADVIFEALSEQQPSVSSYARQNAVNKLRLAGLLDAARRKPNSAAQDSELKLAREYRIAADTARRDYFRQFPVRATQDLMLFVGRPSWARPAEEDNERERLSQLSQIIDDQQAILEENESSLQARFLLAKAHAFMAFQQRRRNEDLYRTHVKQGRDLLEQIVKELADPTLKSDPVLRRDAITTMYFLLVASGDRAGADALRDRWPAEVPSFRPGRRGGRPGGIPDRGGRE